MISDKVAPANTALSPLPKPKIKIEFAELVEGLPKKESMYLSELYHQKAL